jgi:hypothetical protein
MILTVAVRKRLICVGPWWLTPVIVATQEAEIRSRRIMV